MAAPRAIGRRTDLAAYDWLLEPLRQSVLLAAVPLLAFILVAALDFIRPAEAWNRASSVWLQGPYLRPMVYVSELTGWIFSAPVTVTLVVIGCGLLLLRRRWLVAASLAGLFPVIAAEVVLKFLLHRPTAAAFLQLRNLTNEGTVTPAALAHGFPSGHAARETFLIGWLAILLTPPRYRPLAGLVTFVAIVFVAWTRLYVGDHSVLELIAGMLLAAMFLLPAGALQWLAGMRPRKRSY